MIDDGRIMVGLGLAGLVAIDVVRTVRRGIELGGSGSRCAACGSPNRGRGSLNCGCGGGTGSLARGNQSDVLFAWTHNRPGQSGPLRTDGSTLWSYSSIIGETFAAAGKIAYMRADGTNSNTTSKHIAYAKRVADKVLPRREDTVPARGIAGPVPTGLGQTVPRPRQPHEATQQEREWEGRGPWHVRIDDGEVVIRHNQTGKQKKFGSIGSRRGNPWENATKEAAARNKKAAP